MDDSVFFQLFQRSSAKVEPCFRGDCHGWVRQMQEDFLPFAVHNLWESLRAAYRRAEKMTAHDSRLGEFLDASEGIDLASLDGWYKAVAAEFRYTHAEAIVQPKLPCFTEGITHQVRIRRLWQAYLEAEIDWLLSEEPEMVRALLFTSVVPHTDPARGQAFAWLTMHTVARFDHYRELLPAPLSGSGDAAQSD